MGNDDSAFYWGRGARAPPPMYHSHVKCTQLCFAARKLIDGAASYLNLHVDGEGDRKAGLWQRYLVTVSVTAPSVSQLHDHLKRPPSALWLFLLRNLLRLELQLGVCMVLVCTRFIRLFVVSPLPTCAPLRGDGRTRASLGGAIEQLSEWNPPLLSPSPRRSSSSNKPHGSSRTPR